MQIIAHRGASRDAPENTLAALRLAFDQNADAAEVDAHMTADGKVIVLHDPNTFRTARVRRQVAESSWSQLQRLEVGNWGKWRGKGFSERIPLLEEALAILPPGKRLFIEIKCGPEVLPELERVLVRSGRHPAQLALIGFKHQTVAAAKARLSSCEVCWLVSKQYVGIEKLIARAKAAGLDGLDLERTFPINTRFVAKVHQAGLKLYTWTVDDGRTARKQAAAGVDGLATNRPEWIRQQLARPIRRRGLRLPGAGVLLFVPRRFLGRHQQGPG